MQGAIDKKCARIVFDKIRRPAILAPKPRLETKLAAIIRGGIRTGCQTSAPVGTNCCGQ